MKPITTTNRKAGLVLAACVFWNPAVLRHYLDGIQFALRDLPADATPNALIESPPR